MDQVFCIILCTSLHISSIGLVVVARKWVQHQLAAVVILNYTGTVNEGVDLLELDYSISIKESYGGDHCLLRSAVFVFVCTVEQSNPFVGGSFSARDEQTHDYCKSRNKLNFWPRKLVAALGFLALIWKGSFELRPLTERFELRCILAITHFLSVPNFPIHLIFL